jgi:hypothetical protein
LAARYRRFARASNITGGNPLFVTELLAAPTDTTKTVDNHVGAILAKLGVPSRALAVSMARRHSGEEA